MRVRFLGDCIDVEYGWGASREPVQGDVIRADGSDPDLPPGDYRVAEVQFEVGIRGPSRALVYLRRVRDGRPRLAAAVLCREKTV